MFKEIKDQNDPCIQVMINKTEEGQKVERNQGSKYWNTTPQDNLKVYCNTVEHPSFYDNPRTYEVEKPVTIIDIGCGFGGLLFGLSPLFPDNLCLGLEIRDKLVNYVGQKVKGHRYTYPGKYNNISVVRTNTMRHLCQYFPKASL